MLLQRPHAIHQVVRDDYGWPLSRLGGLEGLGRSVTVTVLPLAAFATLGSKEAVTYAYFAGSFVALFATLNVGTLESWMARRWVVTLGIVSIVIANIILLTDIGPLIPVAMGLVATEAAIFAVCMSLFIMDYIDKRELRRNESRRMVHNGVAWMIGPMVSILLYTEVDKRLPFLAAIVCALAALTYFWVLRLGANPVLSTPKSKAPNPLQNIPRYFQQKYLRIAYLITLVRGTFWASFFIYAPLYTVEAGLPAWTAGGVVSAVAMLLILSPTVLWFTDHTSTRFVIISGFILIAASLVVLGLIGDARPVGVVFWITGAWGASWLDVLGNIPFMRTVKPRERVAMTTVFSSWRETSSFVAPGLAALVLLAGPFWVFYFILAGACLVTAFAAATLPRRI
jgi:MFS transporter, ACDE family, multidrug resistance protein